MFWTVSKKGWISRASATKSNCQCRAKRTSEAALAKSYPFGSICRASGQCFFQDKIDHELVDHQVICGVSTVSEPQNVAKAASFKRTQVTVMSLDAIHISLILFSKCFPQDSSDLCACRCTRSSGYQRHGMRISQCDKKAIYLVEAISRALLVSLSFAPQLQNVAVDVVTAVLRIRSV